MRPFWKGFISFGLVSIPVKLFPATETKSIGFSLLHKEDGAPIKYKKFCEHCNEEIGQSEIVKGYEFSKGQYVTFSEDELESISELKGRQIEITDFVDLKEVDPIYFQKSYYLAPGEGGEKPYMLLLTALKETNRIAIAKISLRTKESISMLRVYEDNTLALSTVFYPDEIRKTSLLEIPDNISVNETELSMAKMLIDNLTHPFQPEKYKDEYREKLNEIIQKKIINEKIEYRPEAPPANVIDLTEALKLSLEKITGENPDVQAKEVKKKKVKKTAS